MAAIDQLGIYNGALLILKENPLAVGETRNPRPKLDDIWGDGPSGRGGIKACLEAGGWTFAKRSVRLDADPGITPQFGYLNGFQLPPDYVRKIRLSSDEFHQYALNRFEQNAGFIFAPITPIYLEYVSNDEDYGGNMGLWPESFIEYVKSYFAFKLCGRLTGSKTDPDKVEKEMDRCLTDALGKEAIERPTEYPRLGTWARSRMTRWNRSGRP